VSELRSWFLRDVLDALERDKGSAALEQQLGKLPPRLRPLASPARLRATGPTDTVSLDEGEELMLALDASIGDGSGRLLETVSADIFSRTLSFGGVRASSGDLYGTMARLEAAFERPFVTARLIFDLQPTDTGFTLTVGIPGRPRAARLLRHLALGAIRAAQRHCHGDSIDLRLFAETVADRANVTARYRSAPDAKSDSRPEIEGFPQRSARPAEPIRERRSSRSMRAITQPRLSEEVERILSSAPTAPAPALRTSSGARFLSPPEDESRISSVPPASNRDSGVPAENEDGGGKTPSSSRTG